MLFFLSIRRSPFNIYVLRNDSILFSGEALQTLCRTLCGKTQYKKTSVEEAPQKADCLTSIFYIFKTYLLDQFRLLSESEFLLFFRAYYIGDMPKMLVKVHTWQILKIETKNLKAGDLLFVSGSKPGITHVGLALSTHQIFHCSKGRGATICPLNDFLAIYKQSIPIEEALHHKDPRRDKITRKICRSRSL